MKFINFIEKKLVVVKAKLGKLYEWIKWTLIGLS
jgi:hypothetical protein